MEKTDFMIEASGSYLCDYLPRDYANWDEEHLHSWLEENAWEPFDCHEGYQIFEYIENLATTLERVAKDYARKHIEENV